MKAFLACRLIPYDKNPGLRSIGFGELLRRVIEKAIMTTFRENIVDSVGLLQVCAGHESGCEAAIHTMREIFSGDETEAVRLIDALNVFNVFNRNTFLHNVQVVCLGAGIGTEDFRDQRL